MNVCFYITETAKRQLFFSAKYPSKIFFNNFAALPDILNSNFALQIPKQINSGHGAMSLFVSNRVKKGSSWILLFYYPVTAVLTESPPSLLS